VTTPTSFTVALEEVGPIPATAKQRRLASARVWRAITARIARHLPSSEHADLGDFSIQSDAAGVTVAWPARRAGAERRPHVIALAAAMEAPALAKSLAPLGLRPRALPAVHELLEPPPAAGACGLCRAALAQPTRWGALRPEALAALGTVSPEAMRAAPDDVVAALEGLLAGPDLRVAVAAAGRLGTLLSRSRVADKARLGALVAAAWRHPDATVARASLRCAKSLGGSAAPEVSDAWVDAVTRFRDDEDALRLLGFFSGVAARSDALAAALTVWLRAPTAGARRQACERLGEVLKEPLAWWPPGHEAAFEALKGAAAERLEAEYVPLLLRYVDRLKGPAVASVVAWLDATDFDVFAIAKDLLRTLCFYPALRPACVRALRHPLPQYRAYAFRQRDWWGDYEGQLSAAIPVLQTAAAETDGTPIGDELRDRLDWVLCRNLAFDRPSNRRLATALLAPGTSDVRLAATAARVLDAWVDRLRDEKLHVVGEFVRHGNADVLLRAYRDLAARPSDDGGALAARVGLGLSWSMQRSGAWAEGGEVAGVAAAVAPASARPNLLYNQACGCAMTGDAEGTARLLAEAIVLDPKQADDARADADMAGVRGHPAMVALLGPAEVVADP